MDVVVIAKIANSIVPDPGGERKFREGVIVLPLSLWKGLPICCGTVSRFVVAQSPDLLWRSLITCCGTVS